MTKIGYARVSTNDQHPESQRQRLLAAGCDPELIFTDHGASGAKASRPEWDRCLSQLRKGDTLVITKLDRAGRSVRNLLDVVELLSSKRVGLEVIDQHVDTETAFGRMLFTVLAAVAEFERELIRELRRSALAEPPSLTFRWPRSAGTSRCPGRPCTGR